MATASSMKSPRVNSDGRNERVDSCPCLIHMYIFQESFKEDFSNILYNIHIECLWINWYNTCVLQIHDKWNLIDVYVINSNNNIQYTPAIMYHEGISKYAIWVTYEEKKQIIWDL